MSEPEIRPQDERISLTQLLEKLDKLNLINLGILICDHLETIATIAVNRLMEGY